MEALASAEGYTIEGAVVHTSQGDLESIPSLGHDAWAVAVWFLQCGTVGGVDISDLRVVTIAYRAGPMGAGEDRIVFVDERATPEQMCGVLDVYEGRMGGPLSCHSVLGGAVDVSYQAPIDYHAGVRRRRVAVGDRLSLSLPVTGSRQPATADLARVFPGPVGWWLGWTGRASRLRVRLPEHSLAWEAQACPAFEAAFRVSAP